MEMKIIPSKYEIIARIFPATIVLIPFLLFTMNCDISILSSFFQDLLKVKIVGNLTIALVLLYLLSQINRFLGKFIFERILFRDELEMPTTKYMLFSDSKMSRKYKMQIRERIKSDFNIDMPNELDEETDLVEAKKRIVDTVGLIREKVKDGRLLLQHNIEYGFARNLIGGAIVGLIVSLFDTIYFYLVHSCTILYISISSTLFFGILLICCKPIINHLGNQYAKCLLKEYTAG
ncbi:hypothetical protein [Parabacteroides sp. FAFU027]|uniref:hypothetical protein n=1 Tax=Parabacteroides sp. FAFU027 TaxID=2922715 RepID=UPI001FAFD87E|nr:hypothetical protein [Parabacteroides sp. FAFU027]